MDSERSRDARALAEAALAELAHELRDHDPPLIVIGGLVPDVLTRDQAEEVHEVGGVGRTVHRRR